jgi:hypothetical protein
MSLFEGKEIVSGLQGLSILAKEILDQKKRLKKLLKNTINTKIFSLLVENIIIPLP